MNQVQSVDQEPCFRHHTACMSPNETCYDNDSQDEYDYFDDKHGTLCEYFWRDGKGC